MSTNGHQAERCWVTLLTQASYLPGVITLAFSLSVQNSIYPLVVLVTHSVPKTCLQALKLESEQNPLVLIHLVESLAPPDKEGTIGVAKRFEDTWTKLRAFGLLDYDACVFLDADITVYKNIDELFDTLLPGRDWIAACHACVCNLDHDPWAPDDWNRSNCAYSPLKHPSALHRVVELPKSEGPPHTHALLNGGVFFFHPSQSLWKRLLHYFNICPDLHNFKFPDQDFLAEFFAHKWLPLSWQYNAIKTMRQWHTNIWRDDEAKALHYIVDKPWQRRVATDGIAGHLGRDGETHSWWWGVYGDWRRTRVGMKTDDDHPNDGCNGSNDSEVVKILDEMVAPELTNDEDAKQCKGNVRKGFPVPIPADQE